MSYPIIYNKKVLVYRPGKSNKYHERTKNDPPTEIKCLYTDSSQFYGTDVLNNLVYSRIILVRYMTDITNGDLVVFPEDSPKQHKVIKVQDLPSVLSGSTIQKIVIME